MTHCMHTCVQVYANGERYEGYFWYNMMHGQGEAAAIVHLRPRVLCIVSAFVSWSHLRRHLCVPQRRPLHRNVVSLKPGVCCARMCKSVTSRQG